MDALREQVGSEWRLLRFRHGCSASTDGVGVDVITAPAWMLCGMCTTWVVPSVENTVPIGVFGISPKGSTINTEKKGMCTI